MFVRLIAGAGLFALGYYLGKQIGRMEPIREDLERAPASKPSTSAEKEGNGAPEADADRPRG